jgi:hypothetical protein
MVVVFLPPRASGYHTTIHVVNQSPSIASWFQIFANKKSTNHLIHSASLLKNANQIGATCTNVAWLWGAWMLGASLQGYIRKPITPFMDEDGDSLVAGSLPMVMSDGVYLTAFFSNPAVTFEYKSLTVHWGVEDALSLLAGLEFLDRDGIHDLLVVRLCLG